MKRFTVDSQSISPPCTEKGMEETFIRLSPGQTFLFSLPLLSLKALSAVRAAALSRPGVRSP